MGRNLWLPESSQLPFTTGKQATTMQNLSQRGTEGFQQASMKRLLKNSLQDNTDHHIEDEEDFDPDLPNVFEDSICGSPKPVTVTMSELYPVNDCNTITEPDHRLTQRSPSNDVPSKSEPNSMESIPSVPNIVIQYASTDAIFSQRPVPLTSKTMHIDLQVSLFSKKGRTHSDSAIYESDQKKQCLRSSLGNSRSLSSTPSSHLACGDDLENLTTCDMTRLPGSSSSEQQASENDRNYHLTSEKPLDQKPSFLQPILWNFSGLDHFTLAQEKSPKLYWLRRHSDSNVVDDERDAMQVEHHHHHHHHHTPRSQSTGDTIPGIEQRSVQHEMEHEDETKNVLHLCKVPVEGCSSDGRKCQKVKKYLQTRYQNQSIDADDVFTDATEFRAKQVVKPVESDNEVTRSVHLDSSVRLSKHLEMEVAKELHATETEPLCDGEQLSETGGGVSKEFDSADHASTAPSLPSRQTVFEFSFPTVYSVLRDVQDCSGNIIFGLLPQSCFSAQFVHSPVPLESFSLPSTSPTALYSKQDHGVSSPDLVSESKRWQKGNRDGVGCKKREARTTGRFTNSVCNSDKIASPNSPFKICQSPCRSSSTDKGVCIMKHLEQDIDVPSTAFGSSLQALNSPSPSTSAVGTPTKSSPQIVFDYQFSERIHEQKQGGENSNFVCPVCGSVFLTYNSLANHVGSHLPSEVVTQDGNENSKVHLCKVCNRSFSRSDMLSRHMRLHTGLRPYECHLCQQVFSRSDHLHTHLRTHTGEKPYRCSYCLYAAPRRDMVTRHMRIHVRGGARRGRRSSSTSSLASEVGQTSDDNTVFEAGGTPVLQTPRHRLSSGRGKANSFQKQRNWSLTSADNNEGHESFEDKESLKMTRTESTTSIDSGVSYLTPRSLVPSLWSPGIDSPDVFSRYPGHFLWPTTATSPEIKHDLEKGVANFSSRDTDFEMHTSFQKCQVASPLEQNFSANSDEPNL